MFYILEILIVERLELRLEVLGKGLDSLISLMIVWELIPQFRKNISDVKTEEISALIISFFELACHLIKLVGPGWQVIIYHHVSLHHFENWLTLMDKLLSCELTAFRLVPEILDFRRFLLTERGSSKETGICGVLALIHTTELVCWLCKLLLLLVGVGWTAFDNIIRFYSYVLGGQ